MTHIKRWAHLERAGELFNERQAARIVQLLCDTVKKALRCLAAAEDGVSAVLTRLNDLGIDKDEVQALGQQCLITSGAGM